MSDDKREKLREYLRNNRPRNNINLGNDSNKNLDNLNNSSVLKDQNSAQISNSKTNSNKRDYDKEPLFIKNHNPDVSSFRGFCFLVLVFISLFIVDIPTDRKIFNFFAAIILASRLATDPNKGKIIEFKNDKIVCYKESFQKEIKISSKLKIKKTVQMFYGFYNDNLGNFKQNIPFFIVLFCFSLIFIQIFIENLYLFILIFIGIISLFFLPSAIDLNNDGIKGTNLDYKINFDLDNNGFKEATSWIDNNDAFITIDKNNNGAIDNGSELFGNKSISNNAYAYTNPNAKNGFEALSEFDSNNDGIIDINDEKFANLNLLVA